MRRIIKTSLLWAGAIVKTCRAPKVVFYHDVGTDYTPMGTNATVFRSHMNQIRNGDVVCFDDGFRGAWDHREILPQGAKIFIAIDLVGKQCYLTWDEIRVLQKDYGVDFQCHTWSHQTLIGPWNAEVPLADRTEAWYDRELVQSKSKIEEELGKTVDELCFPVGYFSDGVIERCKRAGYKKVYASYPGNVSAEYVQPRCLCQDLSPMAFRAVLLGGMNVFAKHYRARQFIG